MKIRSIRRHDSFLISLRKSKSRVTTSGFAVPVCGSSAVLHRTRGPNYCNPKGPQFSDSRSRKILVYDQANLTAIQGELSVPIVTLLRDVVLWLVICGLGNVPPG